MSLYAAERKSMRASNHSPTLPKPSDLVAGLGHNREKRGAYGRIERKRANLLPYLPDRGIAIGVRNEQVEDRA